MPSGYTTALTTTVALDVGVLKYDVSGTATILGVSDGGLRFSPNIDWQNIPFDNKRDDIEGLDRVLKRDGVISGEFIQITEAMFTADILEPNATPTTAGTPTTVTYTPAAASALIAAGQILTNLDLELTRGDTKVFRVRFTRAICTKYEIISVDRGAVKVSCEFHSRLSASAAASSTDTASYITQLIG